MPIEMTYTQARANFAKLCDAAADNREVVFIRRRNAEDVALVAADELSSLLETAHLLRSPKNAQRLLAALSRARKGGDAAQTVDQLRSDLGLDVSEG
jgi:antitoxin YefM